VIEVEARVRDDVEGTPLVRRAAWICERMGVRRATVGLMVIAPDEMARINDEHRGKAEPTDVLSFPIDGADALDWDDDGPPPELGDVIICPEAAQEPLESLVVHGVLHLLGYDHETDDGEMLALQDRLVDEAEAASA
jgi:probable rRNA maturation factor